MPRGLEREGERLRFLSADRHRLIRDTVLFVHASIV